MYFDTLPKDPVILLSFVNTQLRDNYSTFEDFCLAFNTDKNSITSKLSSLDYTYDADKNQFICS